MTRPVAASRPEAMLPSRSAPSPCSGLNSDHERHARRLGQHIDAATPRAIAARIVGEQADAQPRQLGEAARRQHVDAELHLGDLACSEGIVVAGPRCACAHSTGEPQQLKAVPSTIAAHALAGFIRERHA